MGIVARSGCSFQNCPLLCKLDTSRQALPGCHASFCFFRRRTFRAFLAVRVPSWLWTFIRHAFILFSRPRVSEMGRHPFSKAHLQHSQTVIQPCMWFMEEPSQFPVGQTAPSLTCFIMEKPHTRLDDYLNMLLSCFRTMMSGGGSVCGRRRPFQTSCKTRHYFQVTFALRAAFFRGQSAVCPPEFSKD